MLPTVYSEAVIQGKTDNTMTTDWHIIVYIPKDWATRTPQKTGCTPKE